MKETIIEVWNKREKKEKISRRVKAKNELMRLGDKKYA